MNPYMTIPEYSVVQSERTHPMEKRLAYTSQTLLDLVVDLEILSKDLQRLVAFSTRIKTSLFVERRLLEEVD